MSDSTLIHNASQLITLDEAWITPDNPLGIISDGAMRMEAGRIQWIGPSAAVPAGNDATCLDATGKTVTPGLVDSHTHTVFAGDRAAEFEMRLQGKSYQEIAASGGGILKTVQATRQADEETLFALAQERLERMLGFGVTTVEVKSGYGLDFETELKCLRVIRRLQQALAMTIVPTFMGAHDIPAEYRENPDAYVDLVCNAQIPAVAQANLAEFCDVFCEAGYFDAAQSRRIFEAARAHGLKLKIHAEEFADIGGSLLAGEWGATSADHLLNVSDAGIAALKAGGTVATLLPGTAFFLRLKDYAPARKLIAAGVPVALATDFNPGSCMTENLQLIMTLACMQMAMTPVEVLRAVTLNAARALDRAHDCGSLSPGKRADAVLWNIPGYETLFYHMGVNFVETVLIGGKIRSRPFL